MTKKKKLAAAAKFTDDTTVFGLMTVGQETAIRRDVAGQADCFPDTRPQITLLKSRPDHGDDH